jgi:hypothetical protein
MSFQLANLRTTLTCRNETNPIAYGFVGQPTVRGSAQILVTFLFPMISTAFGTLFMRAAHSWRRKGLDFMLKFFFPEISLWKIIQEEILRTRYLNHLHSLGFTSATRQQLMSIQRGKLFVTTPGAAIDYKLLERSYGNKEIAAVATRDGTALDELQAAVWWCSETPKGDCIHLNITNVRSCQYYLASLPTGNKLGRELAIQILEHRFWRCSWCGFS